MNIFLLTILLANILGIILVLYALVTIPKERKKRSKEERKYDEIVQSAQNSITEVDSAVAELNSLSKAIFDELDLKHKELLFLYNVIDEKLGVLENVISIDSKIQDENLQQYAKSNTTYADELKNVDNEDLDLEEAVYKESFFEIPVYDEPVYEKDVHNQEVELLDIGQEELEELPINEEVENVTNDDMYNELIEDSDFIDNDVLDIDVAAFSEVETVNEIEEVELVPDTSKGMYDESFEEESVEEVVEQQAVEVEQVIKEEVETIIKEPTVVKASDKASQMSEIDDDDPIARKQLEAKKKLILKMYKAGMEAAEIAAETAISLEEVKAIIKWR